MVTRDKPSASSFANLTDKQFKEQFINNPLTVAKELLKHEGQKNRLWRLLGEPNNQKLINAYKPVQQILGALPKSTTQAIPIFTPTATPTAQPQPQTQAVPAQEAPIQTAEQVAKAEPFKPNKIEDLSPAELSKLQNSLNNFKGKFFTGYAAIQKAYQLQPSGSDIAYRGKRMSAEFNQLLELYRGDIGQYMLDEAGNELLFSALGPVGDFLRQARHQKIGFKMAWMKNIFNPQAIYYYTKSLPDRYAFKFIKHPVNQTIGLLARSQNPLFSSYSYSAGMYVDQYTHEWKEKIETTYGLTPFTAFSKRADKIANALDVITGENQQPNKYILHLQTTNILNQLNATNKTGDKKLIHEAKQKLFDLIKTRDGGGGLKGFLRNSLFHPLKRLGKNLRQTQRDPLTFLAVIIGNLIFDTAFGIIINGIKYLGSRIISRIPALAKLRAASLRFFTSNPWLSSMNMGKLSFQAYTKAFLSLNAASGAFLGAKSLAFLGTRGMLAGGIIGGTGGWFYQTLINMANNQTLMHWARYEKGVLNYAGKPVNAAGQFLFGRGPMLKAAQFLAKNPWLRFPLTGLAFGNLTAPILQQAYGIPQWLTYGTSMLGNYFWTTRAFWISKIAHSSFIASQFGKLAVRLGLHPGLVADFFQRPFHTLFKALYEGSFVKPFAQPLKRFFWSKGFNVPLQWANKILGKIFGNPTIQRFFKNWLANPGFFMGFELIGVFTALGMPLIPAIILGPLVGGIVWNMGAFILESMFKVSKATLSSLGWIGMTIGWGGQLIAGALGFTLPAWWTVTGWTLALPFSWSLVYGSVQFLSLLGGLTQFGLFATRLVLAMNGLMASGLSIVFSSTLLAVGSVIGLTVFGIMTIYSSFWIPLQEVMHAGSQSACFSQSTNVNMATNSAEICSVFTINTDLLTEEGYISNEIGIYNLLLSDYVNLENNITEAYRIIPGRALENLVYVNNPEFLNPSNPNVATNRYTFPVSENILQLPTANGTQLSWLVSWLSTFTGNPDDNKMTVFELIARYGTEFPGLQQMVDSSFNLLKQVQVDEAAGNTDTVDKFSNMRNFFSSQKSAYDPIRDELADAKNSTTLTTIQNNLNSAKTKAEAAAQTNPYNNAITEMQNNCQFQLTTCQELIQLFQSWPDIFNNQLITIDNLIEQSNSPTASSDLTDLKMAVAAASDSANLISNSLDQQSQNYKSLVDNLDSFQNDLNNWLSILNSTNPLATDIQNILEETFGNMFKDKYFFTPNGTIYTICVKGTYVGDPNKSAYFYSQTNIVQSGFLGIGSQSACTAIAGTTINP